MDLQYPHRSTLYRRFPPRSDVTTWLLNTVRGNIRPSIQSIPRIPQVHDHGFAKLFAILLVGEFVDQFIGKRLERAGPHVKDDPSELVRTGVFD